MQDEIEPQNPISLSPDKYWSGMMQFVDHELNAERQQTLAKIREMSSRELKYQDEIGFLPESEPLNPTGAKPVALLEVPVDDNERVNIPGDYGVYEGNEVLLRGQFRDTDIEACGTVTDIDGSTIGITIQNTAGVKAEKLQSQIPRADNIEVAVVVNTEPYSREKAAIREMMRHRLAPYILGERSVTFSDQKEANTSMFDIPLYRNDRQEAGIEQALRTDQISCLQGPPGTGKTRVIIELVRRLTEAGKRVLVAAETNAAIDNILVGSSTDGDLDERSLHYYATETEDFRLARNNPKPQTTNQFAYKQYAGKTTNGKDVVVSTHNSASKLASSGSQPFDYVIIDEATQATKPSSFVSMTKGEKAVLVGDHKQLPATRSTEPSGPDDTHHISVFEHLYADYGIYGSGIGTRFNVQYRSHPDIMEFSSQQFYDGDLQHGRDDIEPIGSTSMAVFDVEGNNEEQRGTSKSNPAEAEYVGMQVRMLLESQDLEPSEIGVAAAYSAQVDEIQQQLRGLDAAGSSDVMVDTFDSFQGSERTAMVVSFTRSNSHGNIGFLADEIGKRRLNVALTRAKRYCALVGDWKTLQEGSDVYADLYAEATEDFPAKSVTLSA